MQAIKTGPIPNLNPINWQTLKREQYLPFDSLCINNDFKSCFFSKFDLQILFSGTLTDSNYYRGIVSLSSLERL